MKKTFPLLLLAAIVNILWLSSVHAQYFGTQTNSTAANTQNPQAIGNNEQSSVVNKIKDDEKYSAVEQVSSQENEGPQKQEVRSPFDYEQSQGKKADQKNQQPQKRYTTVGGITVETDDEDDDDQLILLYMKNYSVYNSPSGRTRCSMRFAVATTLKEKLSNISYRLKWKDMETVLSFSSVPPGVENYFDYELLGDGCYNMDKRPNIVVNRCRVKGLTQQECANKIRWITPK